MVPLAEAGDVRAQYNLGTMYNNALGVRQDYKEAAKWFSMASAKGYVFATVDMATLYLSGEGVQKDYKEAMRLSRLPRRSKHHGRAESARSTRRVSACSRTKEAAKWYRRAADHGK